MGYSYHKLTDKYEAYITRNKRKFYLGLFGTALEARAATKGALKVLAA